MKHYYSAWDIGGAHLKCAILNQQGKLTHVEQVATPLWQGIDILEATIKRICREYNLDSAKHSITTTAELVDGFPDRNTGLQKILNLLSTLLGKETLVYSHHDGLISLKEAAQQLTQVASANWHATAYYLSSVSEAGVLVDIGSTTTDIVPFSQGELLNRSNTDQDRLRTGEMLYTGVVRTPVMAICREAQYQGIKQFLMAEQFATMADVYRLIGELIEDDDMYTTCDGQEKTPSASARRLGRMLGVDAELGKDIIQFAETIASQQKEMIQQVLNKILQRERLKQSVCLYAAGSGGFLVKHIADDLGLKYKSFAEACEVDDSLAHVTNRSAAAVALAKLMYQ